jgi:hypothetical protein
MPVWVMYQGRLIEKKYLPASNHAVSDLPAPSVQSFQTYASPINDAPISSHRQRDKDLHNSGSYDPRDTPASFRKAQNVRHARQRRSADPSRYS